MYICFRERVWKTNSISYLDVRKLQLNTLAMRILYCSMSYAWTVDLRPTRANTKTFNHTSHTHPLPRRGAAVSRLCLFVFPSLSWARTYTCLSLTSSPTKNRFICLQIFSRGELNHFVNLRLALKNVTKRHDMPIKRLETGQIIEKVAKSNPD